MKLLINLIIFIPAIAGMLCLVVPKKIQARQVALFGSIVTLVMSVILLINYDFNTGAVQFVTNVPWISMIDVEYRTGVDGLSLPLVLLTTALSVLVVAAGWNIDKAPKAYHALYMFLLTGILGVFLALDLFLFYVFFEVSLLPMYFLIGVWGGPRKEYAAIKFFLFTLAGSICLLIVMLGLYFYTPEVQGGRIWAME